MAIAVVVTLFLYRFRFCDVRGAVQLHRIFFGSSSKGDQNARISDIRTPTYDTCTVQYGTSTYYLQYRTVLMVSKARVSPNRPPCRAKVDKDSTNDRIIAFS